MINARNQYKHNCFDFEVQLKLSKKLSKTSEQPKTHLVISVLVKIKESRKCQACTNTHERETQDRI